MPPTGWSTMIREFVESILQARTRSKLGRDPDNDWLLQLELLHTALASANTGDIMVESLNGLEIGGFMFDVETDREQPCLGRLEGDDVVLTRDGRVEFVYEARRFEVSKTIKAFFAGMAQLDALMYGHHPVRPMSDVDISELANVFGGSGAESFIYWTAG